MARRRVRYYPRAQGRRLSLVISSPDSQLPCPHEIFVDHLDHLLESEALPMPAGMVEMTIARDAAEQFFRYQCDMFPEVDGAHAGIE